MARVAIGRLQTAASGSDPDDFERAVCAAFELFGFGATHVGGNDAPDGYADALLGELRYRVMIECKLERPDHIVNSDAVAEAAKYREPYRAQFCALVAPTFHDQLTFSSEMRAHGVAAWTVDDLVRAATLRLDCSRMRELFIAGYAAGSLDDIEWARIHGPEKRLRVVASLLAQIGLAQQSMAFNIGDSASMPRLTADVALTLLDDRLAAEGSTHGVTREEIDAAFAWLTSPYVRRAIWTPFDSAQGDTRAIVIRPSTN